MNPEKLHSPYNNRININPYSKIIFCDMDKTFLFSGSILKGADQLFPSLAKTGNLVIVDTNRAPAALDDPLINNRFGSDGLYVSDNKYGDISISASGTIIMNRERNQLLVDPFFLSQEQKYHLFKTIINNIPSVSLIEWIEHRVTDDNSIPFQTIKYFVNRDKSENKNFRRKANELRSTSNPDESHKIFHKYLPIPRDLIPSLPFPIKVLRGHIPIPLIPSLPSLFHIEADRRTLRNEFMRAKVAKVVIGFTSKNLEANQVRIGQIINKFDGQLKAAPDLFALHVMNGTDKGEAAKRVSKIIGISMENAVGMGNSGIDLPLALACIENGGYFIYVGNRVDFENELNHPLMTHFIKREQKFLLSNSSNLIFHDPKDSIKEIFSN